MQIGVRMGHIPASRRTVTMAIAVIAVITLSIAMLCGCGTARNTNQATDSGSGGNRLASSLQAYATQLLGQDSGGPRAESDTAQGRDKRQNKSVRLQGRMEPIHHVRPRQGLSEADTENLLQRHPAAAGRRTSFR